MTGIDTSYWFITIGAGVACVAFLLLAGWPLSKYPESSKLALFAAGVAFSHCFMGSMLLEEWGWKQRSDGVDYNYMRGIVFAISSLALAHNSACILWIETVLGWGLLLFGLVSTCNMIGMGLSTGAAVWWILSFAVVIPGAIALFIKFFHAPALHGKYKTKGMQIICWLRSFGTALIFAAYVLNQILAPEGNNNYGIEPREWFYMALSFCILGNLLVDLFIYEPVPGVLVQEGYGPVPSGTVAEGEKPTTKNA
jgi:hypothetical protein